MDQGAIEYAWRGAQSVFDTMLTTGVLLVPIGIVLLVSPCGGFRRLVFQISMFSIGLGARLGDDHTC